MSKKPKPLAIPTVGEILLEEFLKPLALSQNALARAIFVPPRRINEIVLGKRNVTAGTDLRLQMLHDIRVERRVLGKKLDEIRPRAA